MSCAEIEDWRGCARAMLLCLVCLLLPVLLVVLMESKMKGVSKQEDQSRTSDGSVRRPVPRCCRVQRRDVIDASKKLGRTSRLQRTTQRPYALRDCVDFPFRVIHFFYYDCPLPDSSWLPDSSPPGALRPSRPIALSFRHAYLQSSTREQLPLSTQHFRINGLDFHATVATLSLLRIQVRSPPFSKTSRNLRKRQSTRRKRASGQTKVRRRARSQC